MLEELSASLKDQDVKSSTPLEVKLVPVGAIAGRLLDDDGLRWTGATLHVWMSDPDRPPSIGCSFGEKVTAAAQVRFRVEAFVPGVDSEVTNAVPNRGGIQLVGEIARSKKIVRFVILLLSLIVDVGRG